MAKIGHYLLHEIIHNTEQYVIYKATLPDSADYFLIKTPSQNNLTDTASAQLQHEYYLLEQLNALSNHFPKVLDFIHEGEQLGLILKDEGYRPVVQSIAKPKHALSPEVLFPLAIELAEITASIHDADIIHKHLIPDNIFYHPDTHALQVYDFIIATQLNRTMVPTDPPRLLQGSLEYMAPEQTGRMNRPLTHRADLYSLGIIFYEWLTGNVPFHSKEPMTII